MILHIPMALMFNLRFGGALDMHVGLVSPDLIVIVTDILLAWIIMSLFLYITGLFFQAQIRMIDIAGAVAVARIPLLISSIPAYFTAPELESSKEILDLQGSELGWLLAGTALLLPFFIWFIVLLFNAFKVNSNLKGWKLGVGFASTVIVAEIVSLFLNNYLTGVLL